MGLTTLGMITLGQSAPAQPDLLAWTLPEVELRPPSLTLPVQPPASTGTVYVLARAGDTGQSIADSYNVDLLALSPKHAGALPWGAVIRVDLNRAEVGPGQLPPGVRAYVVQSGDTLASIAYHHELSVPELLSANLTRETLDRLAVGDLIYVPSTPGLMVRIKAGQTVEDLVLAYGADPGRVSLANGIGLPNELGVGDFLLLPGVIATGYQQQLLARRERQVEAGKQARVQEQYDRALAAGERNKAARLRQQYAVQAQYDKAQAYKNSPERQNLIARFEAQARYDAVQQAARQQSLVQASVGRRSTSVRTTSVAGGSSGLSWPLRSYTITSRFGEADIEFHRQFFHGGVDLAAPYGTPIYAAAGGTVTESGFGDYGRDVYVDTGDALTIYGHMSRTAVSLGQRVSRGEVLGYVGCSGMCTGPHLHFEVRLNGQPVDPLGMLP